MHKEQTKIIILTFDIIAFILAIFISGNISRFISHHIIGNPYYNFFSVMALQHIVNFVVLAAISMFLFYNQGHYSKRSPRWVQIGYIFSVLFGMLLVEIFIHFAVKSQISRLWILSSWFLASLLIIFARQISKMLCNLFNIWNIKTIVIGDKNNVIETVFALYSESFAGYKPVILVIKEGYQDFNKNDLPISYQNLEIIDGSKNYDHILFDESDSFYIIAPDSFGNFDIDALINKIKCKNCNFFANYAVVPPISGFKLYGSKPQYFFGHNIMFLLSKNNIRSPLGRFVKRSMDIILSFLAIIILSPIFFIIYKLIKKDGGPAFFKQKRIGKNGQEFYCLKFRSMRVDAEDKLQELLNKNPQAKDMWDRYRKIPQDPRITKIGKFLRNSSLDELPQLFNILKGEMSLVGPRPIIGDEIIFFDDKEFEDYKSVKPGITGLWQVSGRNDVSFKQRICFDNWYIKNWSIWHDVVIVIKTIFVVIKKSGVF